MTIKTYQLSEGCFCTTEEVPPHYLLAWEVTAEQAAQIHDGADLHVGVAGELIITPRPPTQEETAPEASPDE